MIERINCSDTAMMTKPSEHGAMAKPMVAAARMSGMSTSAAPASEWSAFDVDVNMILSLGLMDNSVQRKALADPLFALLPKRLCVLWIDGVRLYARAYGRVCGDLGHVTVFAIAAANRCGVCDAGSPDGCCCALRNAFIPKGRRALGLAGIDPRDQLVPRLGRHISTQLGLDTSGVQRRRSHASRLVTSIELDCKQHI